jgi:hypothetical protein
MKLPLAFCILRDCVFSSVRAFSVYPDEDILTSSAPNAGGRIGEHADKFVYYQDMRCILGINPLGKPKTYTFVSKSDGKSFRLKVQSKVATVCLPRPVAGAVLMDNVGLVTHEIRNNVQTAMIGYHFKAGEADLNMAGNQSVVDGILPSRIPIQSTLENEMRATHDEMMKVLYAEQETFLDDSNREHNDLDFFKKCLEKGLCVIDDHEIDDRELIESFEKLAQSKFFTDIFPTREQGGEEVKPARADTGPPPQGDRLAKMMKAEKSFRQYFGYMAERYPGGILDGFWGNHYDYRYDNVNV